MKVEQIVIRIIGRKRLIMHSSRLADPLDPVAKELKRVTGKKAKTESDHELISKVEWNGGLWLDGGLPCIPCEALMGTFVQAAKLVRRGPQATAGLVVAAHAPLDYDGPRDMDRLWLDERFRLRVPVRVGNAKTMRTRAVFDDWSATFAVQYLPSLLNRDEVREIYELAGYARGLGDWRPQNGTFTVQILDG